MRRSRKPLCVVKAYRGFESLPLRSGRPGAEAALRVSTTSRPEPMRPAWDALSSTRWRSACSCCLTWPCARTGTEPNRRQSRLMDMHAAGWNLRRSGRPLWSAALLALVALVGGGIWASTGGGNGSESPAAAPPAPVRVAFVFAKPVGTPTSPFGGGSESIYLASPTGNHPLRLARGADPAISPDGRWVVYRRDTHAAAGALLVIGTDGGTARRLPAMSYEQVVWSADSRLGATIGSGAGRPAPGHPALP